MAIMLEILIWLGLVTAGLFFFGLTVFMHELGHYIVARKRGLVVERFAIGFGPVLWKTRRDGVDWCVCAIPFGGYVALPQMATMEMIEGATAAQQAQLPTVSPLDKILTAVAGPLFSFGFGVALAVLVWAVGKPMPSERLTTTVGWVEEGAPASRAKPSIEPGDKILSVDGVTVKDFAASPESVVEAIIFSKGDTIVFEMERDKPGGVIERFKSSVTPEMDKILEIRRVGIHPATELMVGGVVAGSPAENAGFHPGDQILTLNDIPMHSPQQFRAVVSKSDGVPLRVTGKRKKADISLVVVPQVPKGQKTAYVGIEWGAPKQKLAHIPPWRLVGNSLIAMRKTASAVTNPDSDIKAKHLSGPLGILQTTLNLLRMDIRLLLWFAVVLNINLAVINLLPMPVLDGGHIVLSVIEAIMRRPLPDRITNGLQSAFTVVIAAFFIYVTIYDTKRGVLMFQKDREAEAHDKNRPVLEFLPEPSPAREAHPTPPQP